MPGTLTNFGLAVVGGTAYVTGGWRNYPNVVAVSLSNGTWREVSPMLKGRGGHASAEVDGLMYVIAGVTSDTTEYAPSRIVEAYAPSNDTWWRVADYPEPAHSLGAVRVGSTLFAMGGTNSTPLRTMYALTSLPASQPPWVIIGLAVGVGVALVISVVVILERSRRRAPPPASPP
jgi:hypothetical protein